MGWNGFGSLDLSNVQESGAPRLQPGKYMVKCTEAKVGSFGEHDINKRVECVFEDVNGSGTTSVRFNVHYPANADTARIGLEQLKSFLVSAGHPNPDQPGDLGTLIGLKVGVVVDQGKPYTNREGRLVTPNEVKRYLKPEEFEAYNFVSRPAQSRPVNTSAALAGQGASAGAGAALDDEIPF